LGYITPLWLGSALDLVSMYIYHYIPIWLGYITPYMVGIYNSLYGWDI